MFPECADRGVDTCARGASLTGDPRRFSNSGPLTRQTFSRSYSMNPSKPEPQAEKSLKRVADNDDWRWLDDLGSTSRTRVTSGPCKLPDYFRDAVDDLKTRWLKSACCLNLPHPEGLLHTSGPFYRGSARSVRPPTASLHHSSEESQWKWVLRRSIITAQRNRRGTQASDTWARWNP